MLRFYREYTSGVPDELTAYASLLTTPDGEPAIAITLCSPRTCKDTPYLSCSPLQTSLRHLRVSSVFRQCA